MRRFRPEPPKRPRPLAIQALRQELAGRAAVDVVASAAAAVGAWLGAEPAPGGAGGTAELHRLLASSAVWEPELATTLPRLSALLRERDVGAAAEGVALACHHLACWAERSGALQTARAFFHLAHLAWPDNAHLAYEMGRSLARGTEPGSVGAQWLAYAAEQARRQGRWDTAARALLALASHQQSAGTQEDRIHLLAARAARRAGLRTLEGDAYFEQLLLGLVVGRDPAGSLRLARQALMAYGDGHTRLHPLALALAWLLVERLALFAEAAALLGVLGEQVCEPTARLLVLALLTRASAAAGLADEFEVSWNESWALIRAQHDPSNAGALLQLVWAAGNADQWERARTAAQEAESQAERWGLTRLAREAGAVLRQLRGNLLDDAALRDAFTDRSRARDPLAGVEALVDDLTAAVHVRPEGGPVRMLPTLFMLDFSSR